MTFDHWKDAVRLLSSFIEPVTEEQKALAQQLHVRLDADTPSVVAAEQLKRALANVLRLEDETSPSYGQLEFISDLVSDLGIPSPDIATKSEASAWIVVLEARRAIEALRRLGLRRGDVVQVGPDSDQIEIVASIGMDGSVYFAGGRGQRAKAHQIGLLARSGSSTEETSRLREIAELRRVRRDRSSGPPSQEQLAVLEEYAVSTRASADDALHLEHVLEEAQDERPLQKLLTGSSEILSSLVRSSYGTFVVPLPRLGGEYVPDFAIAATDSAGIHWTFVELESPKARVSTSEGRPAAKLRHALDQIRDWREWLDNNLRYARARPDEEGLGLVGVRSDAAALVLIGRTEPYHFKFNPFRHRLMREQRVSVYTYSWLVEVLRFYKSPLIGPLESRDESW